jgi:predicted phosphodiesterase
MTRIALISDIHGNSLALRAVLEDISWRSVDQIICLGDVVGYGPEPEECLALVREHCAVSIRGNHEDAILSPKQAEGFNGHARAAIKWTCSKLDIDAINQIRSMPTWSHIEPGIVCVHDSPVPQDGYGYIRTRSDATPVLRSMQERICLFGHTHLPAVFTINQQRRLSRATRVLPRTGDLIRLDRDEKYLLNPGSVGQPRDGDCRASWGILDLGAMSFSTQRSAYEVSSVRHAITCAGLPTFLGERLLIGA